MNEGFSLFRLAAETNRLAACAPQTQTCSLHVPGKDLCRVVAA
jgi:hypothetical protein